MGSPLATESNQLHPTDTTHSYNQDEDNSSGLLESSCFHSANNNSDSALSASSASTISDAQLPESSSSSSCSSISGDASSSIVDINGRSTESSSNSGLDDPCGNSIDKLHSKQNNISYNETFPDNKETTRLSHQNSANSRLTHQRYSRHASRWTGEQPRGFRHYRHHHPSMYKSSQCQYQYMNNPIVNDQFIHNYPMARPPISYVSFGHHDAMEQSSCNLFPNTVLQPAIYTAANSHAPQIHAEPHQPTTLLLAPTYNLHHSLTCDPRRTPTLAPWSVASCPPRIPQAVYLERSKHLDYYPQELLEVSENDRQSHYQHGPPENRATREVMGNVHYPRRLEAKNESYHSNTCSIPSSVEIAVDTSVDSSRETNELDTKSTVDRPNVATTSAGASSNDNEEDGDERNGKLDTNTSSTHSYLDLQISQPTSTTQCSFPPLSQCTQTVSPSTLCTSSPSSSSTETPYGLPESTLMSSTNADQQEGSFGYHSCDQPASLCSSQQSPVDSYQYHSDSGTQEPDDPNSLNYYVIGSAPDSHHSPAQYYLHQQQHHYQLPAYSFVADRQLMLSEPLFGHNTPLLTLQSQSQPVVLLPQQALHHHQDAPLNVLPASHGHNQRIVERFPSQMTLDHYYRQPMAGAHCSPLDLHPNSTLFYSMHRLNMIQHLDPVPQHVHYTTQHFQPMIPYYVTPPSPMRSQQVFYADIDQHTMIDPSNSNSMDFVAQHQYSAGYRVHEVPDSNSEQGSSQLRMGYKYLSLLPIDAQQTLTRQAYGMDKVWRDEFDLLFSQLVTDTMWTLVELETNPSIREVSNIIGYKNCYIVKIEKISSLTQDESKSEPETPGECEGNVKDHSSGDDSLERCIVSGEFNESSITVTNKENGCSVTSSSTDTSETASKPDELTPVKSVDEGNVAGCKFPTKFRMFIDSAKVRFCCDNCGHGWTSMKGRVVFWYELFQLVEQTDNSDCTSNVIGFCAYKLFGQQCDMCKIENRFERPMWYPEEVTKVLNNLYNKIGQIYFGFKMPPIDKQRRAGKPKTSHNSSLCQACHNGVCTDRN